MEIETIQTDTFNTLPCERLLSDHKTNKFNRVHVNVGACDARAQDNAHHKYRIEVVTPQLISPGPAPQVVERCELNFQRGFGTDGPNGITDQALLAIVLDRYRSFNDGPFRCRENSIVITKLEEAMMWMQKRFDDRSRRVEAA